MNPLIAYLSKCLINLSAPPHSDYVSNTNPLAVVETTGITYCARHCHVGATGDLFDHVPISFLF